MLAALGLGLEEVSRLGPGLLVLGALGLSLVLGSLGLGLKEVVMLGPGLVLDALGLGL